MVESERNYAVIESTSNSTEPEDLRLFDSYAEACNYMSRYYKELINTLNENGVPVFDLSAIVNGQFSYERINGSFHQLPRIVEIVPLEEYGYER